MITPLEEYILKVIVEKMKANNFTATDLSLSMNKNAGFISRLLNPKERQRVNMFHVNTIARIFDCKMSDFFPDPYIEYDETKYKKKGKKLNNKNK